MYNRLMELAQKDPVSLKHASLKYKRKEPKYLSIYSKALISRTIRIPIKFIGKNIQQVIEKNIQALFENKCIVEGFLKPGSIQIITYSSGIVVGVNCQFEVVFECQVCCPVEGMLVQCVAKNITKAGIRAEAADEQPSPVVIFIARDHHYMNASFSNIQQGDKFMARIIGQRYELNDKYVSVIAELAEKPKDMKPRLIIGGSTE